MRLAGTGNSTTYRLVATRNASFDTEPNDTIATSQLLPLGPARTRVSFISYVWNESLREQGVGAGLHKVEMEDEEVVESVQRGVSSRLYDRGRFSPRREVGTHYFHHLLARYMNEGLNGKTNGEE